MNQRKVRHFNSLDFDRFSDKINFWCLHPTKISNTTGLPGFHPSAELYGISSRCSLWLTRCLPNVTAGKNYLLIKKITACIDKCTLDVLNPIANGGINMDLTWLPTWLVSSHLVSFNGYSNLILMTFPAAKKRLDSLDINGLQGTSHIFLTWGSWTPLKSWWWNMAYVPRESIVSRPGSHQLQVQVVIDFLAWKMCWSWF